MRVYQAEEGPELAQSWSISAAATVGKARPVMGSSDAGHRGFLQLQRTHGNRFVTQMFGQSAGQIQRQPKDDDDQESPYPPDWQHGAPTKPVAPDPHVAPDKPPMPDQGPYRTPGQTTPDQPAAEPSTPERIAGGLRRAGVPAWAVAGLIVLIVAALADPEPFTKIALIIGAAAAVLFFIAIGRGGDVPSGAAASNAGSGDGSDDGSSQPSGEMA